MVFLWYIIGNLIEGLEDFIKFLKFCGIGELVLNLS